MTRSNFDPAQHRLSDGEAIGPVLTHAQTLELFAGSVIRPSLAALDGQLEEFDQSDDPGAAFMHEDLADIYQSTVEGYLLTLQSMWERGLRRMLVSCDQKLSAGQNKTAIQKAHWSADSRGLQAHFERLLGFPISDMHAHGDLDLLQHLGNAIRHGDGSSAIRVHELAPNLWFQWLAPGTVIEIGSITHTVPSSAPAHPSFETITLEVAVLDQMILAVLDFWMDLECLRCYSFREIHPSTLRQLEIWAREREVRRRSRHWTAEPASP